MIQNKWRFCCSDCFTRLARGCNTTTAKLWMDLCAKYLDIDGCFHIQDDDTYEIKELERLGFIVTTEDSEGTLVRVKGFGHDFTEQIVFCLERKTHKNV